MLIIGALDEILYKDKNVSFIFKVLECLGNDRYRVLYSRGKTIYARDRDGLIATEIIYPDSKNHTII
jgi:hypothetical protein